MDISKKSQRSAKVYATEIDLYKLSTFKKNTVVKFKDFEKSIL